MPTTPSSRDRLAAARRREKLTQAEWRRQRAEVHRLLAAGEEAAAGELLEQIGAELPESNAGPQDVAIKESPLAGEAAPLTACAAQVVRADQTPRHAAKPKPKPKQQPAPPNKKTLCEPPGVSRGSAPPKRPAKPPASPRRGRRKRRQPKTWAVWFRDRPPWVTSLATHAAMLTLFGLLSFATFGEPGFSLSASMQDDDSWDDLPAEVTLATLETDLDARLDAASDLAAEVELATLIEPVSLTAPADLGDVLAGPAASLMAAVPASASASGGGEGGDQSGGATPAGASGKVSFFGAEADAETIVFVVDNSGSMQHGRMQVTLLELGASIRRLSASQKFYVVFFSDQAYPMFFPKSVLESLPATGENKRAVSQWLRTVEMCLGGRLLDAMDFAAQLKPDVVFLLTDGDIRSPRVVERMTAKDAWGFPIHTLGMGARTPQHAQILQAIADVSGGTARPVNVAPDVINRARARPIPYHNTPGAVWGSAVQKWE